MLIRLAFGVTALAVCSGVQTYGQCEVAVLRHWDHNRWIGSATAVSGSVTVAGTPSNRAFHEAFVYPESRGTGQGLTPGFGGASYGFGYAVDISDDLIVVGSPEWEINGLVRIGASYIYRRTRGSWRLDASILATDGTERDQFGFSVAIDGEFAVIAAPYDDRPLTSAGSVYVYRYNGEIWGLQQKLSPLDPEEADWFGEAVTINGDVLLVGVRAKNNSIGAAYFFRFDGNRWNQTQKVTPPTNETRQFGKSVSLSEGRAAIGTIGEAFIYEFDGNQWTETARIQPPDPNNAEGFGRSVGLSEEMLIVGASGEQSAGGRIGAAHVYRLQGGEWREYQRLVPNDPDFGYGFGQVVDVSGNTAIGSSASSADGSVIVFDLQNPCDTNCNGNVDAFDIEPFLDLLFEGAAPCFPCAGDVDGNGSVDSFDIEPFLECLFP